MNRIRSLSALLLALPLLVFGLNYFVELIPLPEGDASPGAVLLEAMRPGGLMAPLALSHAMVGVMLLSRRLRFVAALLQLPITIGIVAFHATMQPQGLGFGVVLLALNLVTLVDPARLGRLLSLPDRTGVAHGGIHENHRRCSGSLRDADCDASAA